MLDISHLTYSYGRSKPPVLSDFSFTAVPGRIYGLLGPNGAGKSTLLQLVMGALTPGRGEVTFDGVNTRRRLPQTLGSMMLVPEEPDLPSMPLDTYAHTYGSLYPGFDASVMGHCLEVFGLSGNLSLKALSMGQKKKVVLSFAFATQTPLLLMDEPTNGLDIPGKAAFRRLCAEMMTDERVFIISTHQVRDLDQLLDHVLVMNECRLVFSQPVADIQERLSFDRNAHGYDPDRVLCSIPSPGGDDIMTRNDSGRDTEVNLELLFDYALNHSAELNDLFEHNNPHTRND